MSLQGIKVLFSAFVLKKTVFTLSRLITFGVATKVLVSNTSSHYLISSASNDWRKVKPELVEVFYQLYFFP